MTGPAGRPGPGARAQGDDGPRLVVGRAVIDDVVRLAALEVPGVLRLGRGGPAWRTWLGGRPVVARVRGDRVDVRLWVVARPGTDVAALSRTIRQRVAGAVERLLGLELGSVTVVVDGVGG